MVAISAAIATMETGYANTMGHLEKSSLEAGRSAIEVAAVPV
jgi:hypothetical protein